MTLEEAVRVVAPDGMWRDPKGDGQWRLGDTVSPWAESLSPSQVATALTECECGGSRVGLIRFGPEGQPVYASCAKCSALRACVVGLLEAKVRECFAERHSGTNQCCGRCGPLRAALEKIKG